MGRGVVFTDARYSRATTDDGRPLSGDDCAVRPTRVGKRASIGSNATILCGVTWRGRHRRISGGGSDEGFCGGRGRGRDAGAHVTEILRRATICAPT